MPRRQLLGGGKLVSRVNARSCPLTGLTFARFSQPRAKLIFAANPVVAMHHDKPTLMVRIPAGLQTSVEPSRPPQCLRCCGKRRAIFPQGCSVESPTRGG